MYRSYGGLILTEKEYIARAGQGQALFVASGYERHYISIESDKNKQKRVLNIKI